MDHSATPDTKRADKRRRILEAARGLLSEQGLGGLSLRKTASKAGFSPAGVYEYFRDKGDMIEALAREGLKELAERFCALRSHLDPKAELVAMGMAYIRFAEDERELFGLIFSGRLCPRGSQSEPPPADSPYAMLLRTVLRAAREGLIRAETPDSLERAAYALWAQMHGLASLRATYLRNFDADFDAWHDDALNALVASL